MLVGVGLAALLFSVSWLVQWRMDVADREFHRRVVAPAIERDSAKFNHANDADNAIRAWLERMERKTIWMEIGLGGLLLLPGVGIGGAILTLLLDRSIKQHHARAERPPSPGAGELTARLTGQDTVIVAKVRALATAPNGLAWKVALPVMVVVLLVTPFVVAEHALVATLSWLGVFVFLGGVIGLSHAMRKGFGDESVEINPATGRIVFRNFTFLTDFLRNPRQPECVLHSSDILGATYHRDNHGLAVSVRTTRGLVTLHDRLHHFEIVADLLHDFAEVNRRDPAAYRAALEREPKVRTPWWAWLIVLGLSGSIIAFLIWLTGP